MAKRSRSLNAQVEARPRERVEYSDRGWLHTAVLA